mmetsp:Transcript_31480/g.55400  ORF Transcript_31480/g.55400 Transcript_31480/m.55400 type:complete len:203 (-) Transcript_31480:331-939(-)
MQTHEAFFVRIHSRNNSRLRTCCFVSSILCVRLAFILEFFGFFSFFTTKCLVLVHLEHFFGRLPPSLLGCHCPLRRIPTTLYPFQTERAPFLVHRLINKSLVGHHRHPAFMFGFEFGEFFLLECKLSHLSYTLQCSFFGRRVLAWQCGPRIRLFIAIVIGFIFFLPIFLLRQYLGLLHLRSTWHGRARTLRFRLRFRFCYRF